MCNTIMLTNQPAYPVRNDGVVDWKFTHKLTGTFHVVDDVIDNYGGLLIVTDGHTRREWAIKHEDLPA